MTRVRLNEAIPNWMVSGIFTALNSFDVPWKEEDIYTYLDLEYHGNISGDKFVSPLVFRLLENNVLSSEMVVTLANVIFSMFSKNWDSLYNTYLLQYNPIQNYNMVEVMTNDRKVTSYGKTETRTDNLTHGKTGTETDTPNVTETRTDNLTHGKTGTETDTPNVTETRTDNLTHGKTGTETDTPNVTETRTDNLTHGKTGTETDTPNVTETQTPNLSTNKDLGVYGFNSSDDVPSNVEQIASTGTNTLTRTGTDQKTYNLSETDTGTQSTQKTGTDQKTYNLSETDTGTQSTQRTGTDQKTYNLSETDTGTQSTQRTGTDQKTYNLSETDTGTQQNVNSGSDTETRNYTLTREGNIGVTTSQQMIQSERELWLWNFIYNVVFPDVDKILTINIY